VRGVPPLADRFDSVSRFVPPFVSERTTDSDAPSPSLPPSPSTHRADDRTEMDLMVLERLFHRMKFVKTLPTKKRLELGRAVQYLAADAGREIFRQGDVGNHFYVILSGSVEVLILDPQTNVNNHIATLYTGDSFGELALLEEGNVRAAGIVARENSEFLTLGREQYNEILRTESQYSINTKIKFMSELPLLSEVPRSMKQSLAYVLHEKDYPRNAVIVKQGAMVDDIFFVKEGDVRVVREVRDRRLLREKRVLHDGPGRLLRRGRDRGMNDAPPEPPGITTEDAGLVNKFEHLRGSTPPEKKRKKDDHLVVSYVQRPTELDPELARAERQKEKGNLSEDENHDDADWRGQLGGSENGTDSEEEEEEEGGGGGWWGRTRATHARDQRDAQRGRRRGRHRTAVLGDRHPPEARLLRRRRPGSEQV
jgi:CRP-like cAMP-binding protein